MTKKNRTIGTKYKGRVNGRIFKIIDIQTIPDGINGWHDYTAIILLDESTFKKHEVSESLFDLLLLDEI